MIKRLIAFFLTLVLTLSMPLTAFAIGTSDKTLNFSLTYNGEHASTVPTGTVITVEYAVENITDDENFTVYTIANEIYYDHHFFEFVEGSFNMTLSGQTTAVKNSEGANNKLIKEIYINSYTTQEYQNRQVVGTFQLKVIATEGSSTIKSSNVSAYENGNTKYNVSPRPGDLTITVGSGATPPKIFTVTYVSDGDTMTEQGAEGEKIVVRGAPSNVPTGKVFDYWLASDGKQYKPGDLYVVTGNVTFTAVFRDNIQPAKKYTLSFDTNGGNSIASISAEEGTVVSLSPYVPVRAGYTFAGWYADRGLTVPVVAIKLNSNTTVYAKWVADEQDPPVTVPNYKPDILTDEHCAYIVGREGGMIAPKSDITRAEVATIIYRLLDEDIRSAFRTSKNSFKDVKEGSWYNTEVSTLSNLGLIKGRSADTFAPNAPITRAELATIFARMVEIGNNGGVKFKDVSGHWAESYIKEAATAGWIIGDNGFFRPDDNITRAEVMTMVNRVLNRMPESKADLLGGMKTWVDNMNENAWYYLAVQEATNSHTHEMKADGIHERWTALLPDPDWSKLG